MEITYNDNNKQYPIHKNLWKARTCYYLLFHYFPWANVMVNDMQLSDFSLGRSGGGHQVDPLSPLIFSLATESFTETTKSHGRIKETEMGHTTYKTVLYADDVLLFFTKPQLSIPAIMSLWLYLRV